MQVLFNAVLENACSEQGARMSAMDSSSRNAGEMLDRLTLTYNRSLYHFLLYMLVSHIQWSKFHRVIQFDWIIILLVSVVYFVFEVMATGIQILTLFIFWQNSSSINHHWIDWDYIWSFSTGRLIAGEQFVVYSTMTI